MDAMGHGRLAAIRCPRIAVLQARARHVACSLSSASLQLRFATPTRRTAPSDPTWSLFGPVTRKHASIPASVLRSLCLALFNSCQLLHQVRGAPVSTTHTHMVWPQYPSDNQLRQHPLPSFTHGRSVSNERAPATEACRRRANARRHARR